VSNERRAVANNPINANFVVGGIKGHEFDRGKRPGASFLEFDVELLIEG
jgi:hypothetical protein